MPFLVVVTRNQVTRREKAFFRVGHIIVVSMIQCVVGDSISVTLECITCCDITDLHFFHF